MSDRTTATTSPGAPVPAPASDDRPEFDITFADEGVRPEAKVIPEGDVRIEVWNRGAAPHDFVLLQLVDDTAGDAPEVGATSHLAPDERASIDATLDSGVYALIDACCRDGEPVRLLELTVQPGG